MSVLNDLAAKGAEKAGETAAKGEWVDKLVKSGKEEADKLDPAVKTMATAGLDYLAANKGDLAGIGGEAFTAIAARVSLGQVDEAKRIWLSTQATHDERMSALDGAMDASEARAARDEAFWDSVMDVVVGFLKIVGKAALPLLLAAV